MMLQLCATMLNVTCVASLKMNEMLIKEIDMTGIKKNSDFFSAAVNIFERCNRKKCERVQPDEK
ncbi:TPA: hypothetical protein ACG323_002507 [Escherichia coli]|uniref:hypothetical protein n=1 Tax=Escherichia coli TaxID=562 RepID=UPI0013AFE1DA|nr:hypothetical protein [Escherichia coli]